MPKKECCICQMRPTQNLSLSVVKWSVTKTCIYQLSNKSWPKIESVCCPTKSYQNLSLSVVQWKIIKVCVCQLSNEALSNLSLSVADEVLITKTCQLYNVALPKLWSINCQRSLMISWVPFVKWGLTLCLSVVNWGLTKTRICQPSKEAFPKPMSNDVLLKSESVSFQMRLYQNLSLAVVLNKALPCICQLWRRLYQNLSLF